MIKIAEFDHRIQADEFFYGLLRRGIQARWWWKEGQAFQVEYEDEEQHA